MNLAIRNIIRERLLLILGLVVLLIAWLAAGCAINYKSAPISVKVDGRHFTNNVPTNITLTVIVHDNIFEADGATVPISYK
jgi:heme/copper-type cytochrome/quinol oxidase subunit 2